MTAKTLRYINSKPLRGDLPSYWTHLGVGVFETLLLEQSSGGVFAVGLDKHFARLQTAAHFSALACPSSAELLTVVRDAATAFEWKDSVTAMLRIIVLEDDWLLSLESWRSTFDGEKGVKLSVYLGERSLPEIKSCSALTSVLARAAAKKRGCDEALLIDRDGYVREGAWSSFFWVSRAGDVITPSARVLPGITREIVLELAEPIKQQDSSLEEVLRDATEAFITQSTHGVVPVRAIEGRSFDAPGRVTDLVRAEYRALLAKCDPQLVTKIL